MRKFCDIETMTTYTEIELKTEYRIASGNPEFIELYPHFELWLSEICGKNGTFVQVYETSKIW